MPVQQPPEPAQRTEEWLALRKGRITASVAAACLGLDPYKGPVTAWKEIMGLTRQRLAPAMAYGILNEPLAILAYEAETGRLVEPAPFVICPEHPWLGASPDGFVGEDGLLEVKCPGNLPGKVPVHHRIQMLVQIACTGRKWADYFAWSPDQGSFLKRVHPPNNLGGLIKALGFFFDIYVATGVEPPRRKRRKKAC